jgi:hypothetical protein
MFLPCLLFKVANCDLEFGIVPEELVFIGFFKVVICDLEISSTLILNIYAVYSRTK